jgi:para-aminobenzoate synthetase component 1
MYFCPVRSYLKNTFTQSKSDLSDKLLGLARNTPFFTLLDSNGLGATELLCGWEIVDNFSTPDFGLLGRYQAGNQDWMFGHLGYDLKNCIENLQTANSSRIGFPDLHFYRPRFVVTLAGGILSLGYLPGDENEARRLFDYLESPANAAVLFPESAPLQHISAGCTREQYLDRVNELLRHIARGDIYEINFCMEFFATHPGFAPATCFRELNQKAKAPFAAFYRVDNNYLVCASPERYLKKSGEQLISQPIKGTIRRGENAEADAVLKEQLRNDPKERSENVMIVDLVRNDLSRIAARASVRVEELFGIYSFETVHQMISTVSATLREGCHGTDALKATFPMGSMTGAPKVRAMQLAEETEGMKRGLYSGALGYFTPGGDFDFNVVIRSIQYNADTEALSLMVGSAITQGSVPEREYDECLLKARALFNVLGVH